MLGFLRKLLERKTPEWESLEHDVSPVDAVTVTAAASVLQSNPESNANSSPIYPLLL